MKSVIIVALVMALSMGATSVASPISGSYSEGVSLTAEESVLRIGTMEGVDSLNPFLGLTDTSRFFYSLVYDSLFSVGNDLETVGNLATSWWVVPESDPELVSSGEPYGSVWEYNITASAVWHDGEPFTVDEVVWNINLNADYYDSVWAYQPYAFFMDYAEAVDDDTVRIHYYNRTTGEPMPVAYGESLYIPMVPQHMLSSMTPAEISFEWNGTFFGYDPPMVGTGPFMATSSVYDEYIDGDILTLTRNPDYHWAADKDQEVQFDRLEIHFFDDSTAMAFALKGGNLDIADLTPDEYDAIKEDILSGDLDDMATFDGLKVNQYWTEITFNMNDAGPNPARLDPNLRLALAMATDKSYITETFYHGYAEPGSTLISPVSDEWHCVLSPGEIFPYDLDLAAQTLEESGYVYTTESPVVRVAADWSYAVVAGLVTSGTPLSFDMLVRRELPEEHDIAQYLSAIWWEIGVDLNYRVVDEATMATEVYAYEYDLALWYWSSDPDPNSMLFCQSKYAWNAWSDNLYFNPAYDASYNSSVSSMDPSARKWYVDDCQRTHYNDVAYIILAYDCQTYAFRTDTFAGWGDWEADPGRSLDAYWGANPLLFDLAPIAPANTPPTDVALSLPSFYAYVDCLAAFTVSAEDADMDELLIELDFGDGTAEAQTFLANVSTHYETTFMHSYELPGDYELTVTADDQTGIAGHAVDYGPIVLAVLEDGTPPVTVVELVGEELEDGWYESPVQVLLTATDVGGSVDVTETSLNGGEWTEFDDPLFVSTEGTNELLYRSSDTNGNVEAAASIELKIDSVAPNVTVVMDLTPTSSTVTVELEWSDESSGVVWVTTLLDYGLEADGGLSSTRTLEDVEDGEHVLHVIAYDAAGHETSVSVTFDVETSVFALNGPAGPWVVMGMLAAVLAVIGVAGFMMLRRVNAPKT